MKQTLTLALTLLFLFGCASTGPYLGPAIIEPSTTVIGFDFREYTETGFLFAPQDYAGEFEAIGLITVTLLPGAERHEFVTTGNLGGSFQHGYWTYGVVTPEEAIRAAYEKSIEMGADALINFSIKNTVLMYGEARLSGFDVSGFAIKRR